MARIPFDTTLSRARRLRCPRCGEGRLFSGWLRMHSHCAHCKLKYERAPGYFLGSIYINYGVTAVSMAFAYILLHIVLEYEKHLVAPPVIGFCILFPMLFHRYARSFWIGMDCYFDPESFGLNDDVQQDAEAETVE